MKHDSHSERIRNLFDSHRMFAVLRLTIEPIRKSNSFTMPILALSKLLFYFWAKASQSRQFIRKYLTWPYSFREFESMIVKQRDGTTNSCEFTSLCRPDWPRTQRSTCLCLLSAGIKGVRHVCHHRGCELTY